MSCPYCSERAPYGVTVCRGCQAEIVYGETFKEQLQTVAGSVLAGLMVAAVLSYLLSYLFALVFFVWWVFPLCVIASVLLLPRLANGRDQVRYLRHFYH